MLQPLPENPTRICIKIWSKLNNSSTNDRILGHPSLFSINPTGTDPSSLISRPDEYYKFQWTWFTFDDSLWAWKTYYTQYTNFATISKPDPSIREAMDLIHLDTACVKTCCGNSGPI